nr:immunoglobulin heavy chain junction region [Macaca mulatta]
CARVYTFWSGPLDFW